MFVWSGINASKIVLHAYLEADAQIPNKVNHSFF